MTKRTSVGAEMAELVSQAMALIEEGQDNGQTREWVKEQREAVAYISANETPDALLCLIENGLAVESQAEWLARYARSATTREDEPCDLCGALAPEGPDVAQNPDAAHVCGDCSQEEPMTEAMAWKIGYRQLDPTAIPQALWGFYWRGVHDGQTDRNRRTLRVQRGPSPDDEARYELRQGEPGDAPLPRMVRRGSLMGRTGAHLLD